jgi:hypothetical protein
MLFKKDMVYTPEQAEAKLGQIRCEHCDALHQIRRRSLNSTMARQLVTLYRFFNNPGLYVNLQVHLNDSLGYWVHASRYLTFLRMERECLKLRFWGFIEEHPGGRDDGNPHNGYIRLTAEGKAFCERKFKTYKFILTKNQGEGFVGFISGEMIDIIEAGNNKFDYNKEIGVW